MKTITEIDILIAKKRFASEEYEAQTTEEGRLNAIAASELKLSFNTAKEFFAMKRICKQEKVLSWANRTQKTVFLKFASVAEKEVFEAMASNFGHKK